MKNIVITRCAIYIQFMLIASVLISSCDTKNNQIKERFKQDSFSPKEITLYSLLLKKHLILDKFKRQIIYVSVAGVRFLNSIPIVEEGTPVNLKREEFNNEVCYGIYTNDGSKIGYVPRRFVPGLRFRSIGRSYLSSVKPHAVPWERFRVTVLIS